MPWQRFHLSQSAREEFIEEYIFNRLPAAQTVEFETHLLSCETCRNSLLEVDHFVNMLRVATAADRKS